MTRRCYAAGNLRGSGRILRNQVTRAVVKYVRLGRFEIDIQFRFNIAGLGRVRIDTATFATDIRLAAAAAATAATVT